MGTPKMLWFHSWIEIKPTAMEVNCCPVMLTVSIATSHSFYLFDLGIERLRKGIGYPVFQVCQDVVQMPLYRLGSLLFFKGDRSQDTIGILETRWIQYI